MTTRLNLEAELQKQGFQKVAEGSATEGYLTIQIPVRMVPRPGENPVRIFPQDMSLDCKIVDKAEITGGTPGREYVVYQKRPPLMYVYAGPVGPNDPKSSAAA